MVTTPPPRFRFGLRSLFVLVTVVAVGLGWLINEARRQRQTITTLHAVVLNYHSERPRWLLEYFDIGLLERVRTVSLTQRPVGDISALKEFKNLEVLDLSRTYVSDVSALAGMERLRRLDLDHTQVRDVSALSALPQLDWLALAGTPVSDISALRASTALKRLYLSDTQVSDLSALRDLTRLEWLELAGTPITDISVLENFKNLKVLDLADTKPGKDADTRKALRDRFPKCSMLPETRHNLWWLNRDKNRLE